MNAFLRVLNIGILLASWLLGAPTAEAAQSIRVLLSDDVLKLDAQVNGAIWITDPTKHGRAVRSAVHIVPVGKGFSVNGVRTTFDQLTMRGGEGGMTLTWVKQIGKPQQAAKVHQQRLSIPVSGIVHLVRRPNGFVVINQVDLEEYVKGVVPAEVNSSWHPEMLKAQAVAARTYALYQQMLSAAREYDVVASVQDQVYKGRQGIDAAVLRAVEDTKGQVLTYDGAPIYAAFSSTTAGLTEDAVNVWSKDYPYLKGVECPFDLASPYYQWTASFKRELLEHNLRQQGFAVGTISALNPTTLSRGGRVATLRVIHTEGELLLRGEELRKAVGYMVVPSTQFTVDAVGSDVIISGYGAGHAVGMCQWGAKELAELGYPFSTILHYYYPETELQDMALTRAPVPPSS
ncbi:putative Amidase enhancer protein LytB [Nitrospira sp. KM1]|uniref:SpoIID/LytB domain-containing protein n=1 Tax=Nitrospira sp. KM1 TaxID=1936990 RepID=UPI0013A7211D|nr:SpoIID/LytB domain-containing protein [Nitrospira sp. KM1]BCA56130.1 putative Amidase enhancer protein LytB [Nitrospira sp. KM1]